MYFAVPPTSCWRLASSTQMIRRAYQTRPEEKFDVISYLEKHCENFEICEDSEFEQKNVEACYQPNTNTIYIKESVYEKACEDDGRARFTICYEIGHMFLHSNLAYNRLSENKHIPKPYEDPEWQANTFASYLLIPPNEARKLNDAKLIASTYGTSYQAASIALTNAKKAKDCIKFNNNP